MINISDAALVAPFVEHDGEIRRANHAIGVEIVGVRRRFAVVWNSVAVRIWWSRTLHNLANHAGRVIRHIQLAIETSTD